MATAVRDALTPVPGGRVFVRRWNVAGTTLAPIVLLHDSLGSVAQWRGFPAELAAATGRAVVAYDRLGYGRSSPCAAPPGADFISEEAEARLPALLDALGVERCVLFGHSVGGAIALCSAACAPARCAAVVTEAAQAFVEERTLAGIRAAAARFADPAELARLARWHGDKARWVLQAGAGVWLSPQFRGWSLAPVLARVRCPVLAIHGDGDEYGSEAFPRTIAGGVAGPSSLRILAGCGHVPHRERKGEVVRAVAEFLGAGERRDA